MPHTRHGIRPAACALALACGACFPTFQTARIEPGFRIDGTVTALSDQRRHNTAQGEDYMGFLIPAYGFGRRFEIGVPIGVYAEEGLFNSGPPPGDKNSVVIMPYLKLGLLGAESRHRLALIAQTSVILPANIGLRYGKDLGSWEPQIGVNYIFSGGIIGDDPSITRYQELDQIMTAFSVGATWNKPRRPAVEMGVLRNSYRENSGYDPSGRIIARTVFYDLFISMRLSVVK